jgi:hypothetical protein
LGRNSPSSTPKPWKGMRYGYHTQVQRRQSWISPWLVTRLGR